MMVEDQHQDERPRRKPVSGRARRRANRARAALTGVPYSVARRGLDAYCEGPASQGRTIYPASTDGHRLKLIDLRAGRTFAQRVHDARVAADLPWGRARHLCERFPPTRGESGTGVGPLYHGEWRQDVLARVYTTIATEVEGLAPSVGELAWAAELGEETAVDIVCALLDRTARLALDRVPSIRADLSFEGAKQTLDALLVVSEDGHSPGTRVRIAAEPYSGATGTIVGARWELTGPPVAYVVRPDGVAAELVANPDDLVVLAFRAPSRREV
ncbi:hypothetical protein ACIBG8_43275 [Nonomuraea sp. NPDC050556]|uniref:hypothetical protein n=1 Tax=Nonomuraea sp. NPDC050556 TaxID=3364369 RepID=UPI0037B8DA46